MNNGHQVLIESLVEFSSGPERIKFITKQSTAPVPIVQYAIKFIVWKTVTGHQITIWRSIQHVVAGAM